MIRLLTLLMFLLPAVVTFGQRHKKDKEEEKQVLPPPRVWIANIPSYNTTHELMMANPFLVTDSVGCKVSGFTISLTAPGQPFYGPLYVNGNEMSETQKGVIKNWDYPNVTVHIQDIHLNCHETDATSPALRYTYNDQEEKK
jgi:hypothetical protein